MTTFGISMVKDEADIIGETVAHMLDHVDHVIVADNASTDGTRDILADLPVTVIDDPDPAYYQSVKMTALAYRAMDLGADWVVPFDADEWWYSPHADTVGDFLDSVAPQWLCVSADLYDHVPTARDPEGGPIARMRYRRPEPAPLRKVACRARRDLVIHQGNHGATFDGGTTTTTGLIVRHFPYRTDEQFCRKARNGAAAYAATDLPDDQGGHWRGYGAILEQSGPDVLVDEVFHRWFWSADPVADGLIFDPAP